MSGVTLTTKWQRGTLTWGRGLTRSIDGWFKLGPDNKVSPPKFDIVLSREQQDGRKYFYFCELSEAIEFTPFVEPVSQFIPTPQKKRKASK